MDRNHPNNRHHQLPPEFICPLTLDIMKAPYMNRYGHTYEKKAILEWLSRGHEQCPLTRMPLRLSDLIPNVALQRQIKHWQNSQRQQLSENDVSLSPWQDDNDDDDEKEEGSENTFVGFITLPLTTNRNAENDNDDDSLSRICIERMQAECIDSGDGNVDYQLCLLYMLHEDERLSTLLRAHAECLQRDSTENDWWLRVLYSAALGLIFVLFAAVIVLLHLLRVEEESKN